MDPVTGHQSGSVPERSSEVFGQLRPLLFSIAYRMVGSVMDAEDLPAFPYIPLTGRAACWP